MASRRRAVAAAALAGSLGAIAFGVLLFLQPPSPLADAMPLPAPAESAGITLSISPGSKSAASGEAFDLALQVEAGTQPLDAVQAEVTFSPALLQVVDAEPGAPGVQISKGSTLPTLLQNTADNAQGRIQYAAGASLTSEGRPSGTFALATVRFQAVAAGTAAVQFSAETKVTYGGNYVAVSLRNGVVTIQAPTAPGGGGNGGAAQPPPPTATETPVAAAAPAPPQAVGPTEGTQVTTLGPTLSWQQPAGTTQFHVRVIPSNNDGPGINLIIGAPDLVARAQYPIEAPDMVAGRNFVMLPGMGYRWEVRVATVAYALGEGAPEWSAAAGGEFRTPPPSSASLSPVAPQEGVRVATLTPRLTWANREPSVFYYEVQVSKDATFTTDPAQATAAVYWELAHGGVTTPANTYTVPQAFPLEPDTQYFWRVRPRVQGDGTPVAWSATWSFRSP